MGPLEFLTAVWPAEGYYCVATPFRNGGYRHSVFPTINAAAAFAERQNLVTDCYYAVHTLAEKSVWNPDAVDRKTGKKGKTQVRVQRNMLSARCFFFDIDIDPEDPAKHPTAKAAQQAVIDFCKACRITWTPMAVSSGYGIHIYFLLDAAMPSGEWRVCAQKLKSLAAHHGLLVDPSRTTDTASVLRVVGTSNLKVRNNPQPVRLLNKCAPPPAPVRQFLQTVDEAVIRAGITVTQPAFPPSSSEFADTSGLVDELLGSNIEKPEYDATPVTPSQLYVACPQIRRMMDVRGNVSEPEWHQLLGALIHTSGEDKAAHLFSIGDPTYNEGETQEKIDAWRAGGYGPPTCAKLSDVCGPKLCEGCQYRALVKSPLVAARQHAAKASAPKPKVNVLDLVGGSIEVELPQPPLPYKRLKDGGIGASIKNADGDYMDVKIYDHDVYPIRQISDPAAKRRAYVWRIHKFRGDPVDVELDADATYDSRKLTSALTHEAGVFVDQDKVPAMRNYMTAYIKKLQQEQDEEVALGFLGWANEDLEGFILPERIITKKRDLPVLMTPRLSSAVREVYSKGDPAEQVRLLDFYNHPEYVMHQFYIMASLGSPLLTMTNQHGLIVNASGKAGSSKSTALYTGASFWGRPGGYVVNGTQHGATAMARETIAYALSNLPACIDEITHLPENDAKNMAMNSSQQVQRIRCGIDGALRKEDYSHKSTLFLTTSNSSMHNLLSHNNSGGSAGSLRVFEMNFQATGVHEKWQADDFIRGINKNFGHIGPMFIRGIIHRLPEIQELVRQTAKDLERDLNITPAERFWADGATVILVATQLANAMGLVPFDVTAMRDWLIRTQMPQMRNMIDEEYTSSVGVLTDFINWASQDLFVVSETMSGLNLLAAPKNRMVGRYQTTDHIMYLSKKAFKDYCVRMGVNMNKTIHELVHPDPHPLTGSIRPIVTSRSTKKVLGGGLEEYDKGQSNCFVVDMSHPELSGKADLKIVTEHGTAAVRKAK